MNLDLLPEEEWNFLTSFYNSGARASGIVWVISDKFKTVATAPLPTLLAARASLGSLSFKNKERIKNFKISLSLKGGVSKFQWESSVLT